MNLFAKIELFAKMDLFRRIGVSGRKYDLPSSPTLLPKEKGARILVPSPTGRGLG
jgi:hypothetical protein